MKRASNLFRLIATRENLCLAFRKASRGKRHRPEVVAFCKDFDANIETLRQGLVNGCLDIGHYHFFRVQDPKPRDICAASFPERVLHHAVMNQCTPVLEAYAIHDSYACRVRKGTTAALARARRFCRRFPWYLKTDIRKYFDSIDHDIMMRLLERRFKDRPLLRLFDAIMATYHTRPGKGLPIGNLISQHLANFYLGALDHYVKETLRVKGYVRYMDDCLFFGSDKRALKEVLESIRAFLETRLALQLKPNTQLNRCRRGIPFLGFRLFPFRIRLSARHRRGFVDKFRRYEAMRREGAWTDKELLCHMEPLIAYTRLAQAKGFRRQVIQRFGVSP